MAQAFDPRLPAQPPPLRLSRLFHAAPATVFRAWGSAESIKRWFSPAGFTVPEARVELRSDGLFEVCMRAPTGQDHWTRGRFVEVTAYSRLVIDMHAVDAAGRPLFRAFTEIGFAEAPGGTRMDVVQTYTFEDPAMAAPMVAGAPEGWRTTLDKLAALLAAAESARSVVHGSFRLQRTYPAPAASVWRALTDPAAKARWFSGPAGQWTLVERHMDVREGGRERVRGRFEGGVVSSFDAVYHDVVPNERLVYSYAMHLDDRKISVSLATVELAAKGASTILTVAEHGAFLDGYDDAGSREHGTGFLLDALGASLSD